MEYREQYVDGKSGFAFKRQWGQHNLCTMYGCHVPNNKRQHGNVLHSVRGSGKRLDGGNRYGLECGDKLLRNKSRDRGQWQLQCGSAEENRN